ncbi:MAG: hypothetical protein LBL80_05105 [Ruminococcus sp.]|jgi:bacteriocin-like protein|nr:hypothetical protein [Ruminococcus sp.]
MKKEELIKKAAERGVTLSEEQAEKYLTLSDEELANIAGGGSCVKRDDIPQNSIRIDYPNHGYNCPGFIDKVPKSDYPYRTCEVCGHSLSCFNGANLTQELYCTNLSVWE